MDRTLGFYKKKLSTIEIALLATIYIICAIGFYFLIQNIYSNTITVIFGYIDLFFWFLPLCIPPISDRFKNLYFVIPWLIICILLAFISRLIKLDTALLPLLTLFITQIYRITFILVCKYEPTFIYPNQLVSFLYPLQYGIEKRRTNYNRIYSAFIFIIGGIMTLLINSIFIK